MTAGVPPLRLRSAATALPGPAVDNQELGTRLGLDAEWIDLFIGTRTRHFAVDLADGERRCDLADLATEAGRAALHRARLTPGEVDFVVLATATPDALMPTTATTAAERLGVSGVPVYQIQSGCSGAVQALSLAGALVRTGAANGLVLAGDVSAKHLDLRQDFRRLPRAELVNYVLFGDGLGAAVVTGGPGGPGATFTRLGHRPVRPGLPPGQRVEWFGAADRHEGRPAVAEDYKAVEQLVPAIAEETCRELLDGLGWRADAVRHLLPPQLGGRMTARIANRLRTALGLDAAVEVSCVARTGNTGNALVLGQLEELLDRSGPGDRALGVCVEASGWIAGGFALVAD